MSAAMGRQAASSAELRALVNGASREPPPAPARGKRVSFAGDAEAAQQIASEVLGGSGEWDDDGP